MQDAVARGKAGAIVRLARRAADLTQSELGQEVGYTAASISRMERGKQPMRDVVLLQRVATVLGIPPHLLGLASRHETAMLPAATAHRIPAATRVVGPKPPFGEEGEDPVQRRNILAGLAGAATSAVFGPAPQASARPSLSGLEDLLLYRHAATVHGPDPTPATVTAAVDAARRDFGACRYDQLARALPARIALAQALGTVGHPAEAAAAIAELYNTATRLCIKLGEDGLAAVTADRALTAALNGADALTVAEAHRMVSSSWRRTGHFARATDVAVRAAQQLAADRTTPEPERLSVQGNLYATAAYTAAKQGDRHTAHVLIAEAEATANQLGRDDTLHGSVFGPSQVLLHQISISHLLGDAGQAIEHARRVNVAHLPTQERQARYWIDVARSYGQWGKPERCYRALLAAEQAAGQEVRRAAVRTMTIDLLRYDRTLPGVRAFANRVGALT
uniref:helix-turn-helix domain-containing protein n=1 Tax=Streptomyces sp. CA-136453 TaxID=3240050 RepID=UPI003F49297B